MKIITTTRYQCETCEASFSEKGDVYACKDCGKDICIACDYNIIEGLCDDCCDKLGKF